MIDTGRYFSDIEDAMTILILNGLASRLAMAPGLTLLADNEPAGAVDANFEEGRYRLRAAAIAKNRRNRRAEGIADRDRRVTCPRSSEDASAIRR